MLDQRVVARVLGDDMKVAGGIGHHRTTQIVGEGEIEGVPAGGGQAHELRRGRALHQLLDQGRVQFGLPGTQQQREADRLAANDREVNLMNVLEIHKDVVHRRREIRSGMDRHKRLTKW